MQQFTKYPVHSPSMEREMLNTNTSDNLVAKNLDHNFLKHSISKLAE